jgi:serine/threonine protein phosphatase PrpC
MIITIYPPLAMNERGRRATNQDTIFPQNPNASDTLFMVCDGVGGMAHGEDASRIICQSFAQSLKNQSFTDANQIAAALTKAETALNDYAKEAFSPKGMATTLTLLHLHHAGATVAHIGDSRVYQFRKNAIVFKTKDHSWVNELVENGVITPEQARTHPQRNVIARAIQAGKPAKADVVLLKEVLPDDYFFLCSDGILEHLIDNQLIALMNSGLTDSEKRNEIFKICQEKSKDNFSCCLVHIKSVDQNLQHGAQNQNDTVPILQKSIPTTPLHEKNIFATTKTIVTAVQPRQSLSEKLLRLFMILALISGLICIVKVLHEMSNSNF